ncbi:MAG TPA: hypothetical protein VKB55_05210 [Nocardioidaceae bacterium]|nr:hypothetical protein [Nocardioidaceae bacterium]
MNTVAAELTPAGDQTEVVRWYTHARRFPILIGKAGMNGDPLPGGPYTSTQVVAWFATLAGLYFTRDMWGQFGDFMNAILLLGLPIAVGWAARWIPHDARNPMLIAAGWIRCFGAPTDGRVDGVPVRLRSPYQLRHKFLVDPRSYRVDPSLVLRRSAPSRPRSRSESADRRGTSDGSTPSARRPVELTSVQALLANRR